MKNYFTMEDFDKMEKKSNHKRFLDGEYLKDKEYAEIAEITEEIRRLERFMEQSKRQIEQSCNIIIQQPLKKMPPMPWPGDCPYERNTNANLFATNIFRLAGWIIEALFLSVTPWSKENRQRKSGQMQI